MNRQLKRRDFLRSSLQLLVATQVLPSIARAAGRESLALPLHRAASRSFAVIGDCGWVGDGAAALRASIKRAGLTKLVMPGDNLYNPEDHSFSEVWDTWREEGFEFSVVAIGNHTAGYEEEREYFSMPGEYYARQDGPCLFLVLNSDNEKTVTEQRDWLRQQLASATASCIFVVFHHPPASITNHHGWGDKAMFQNALRPVLMEFAEKISALFVGHDHIAGLYSFGSIPMIVSGAGVQAQTAGVVQNQTGGVQLETKWVYNTVATWVRLDVDETGTDVRVNFINVETADVHSEVLVPVSARRAS